MLFAAGTVKVPPWWLGLVVAPIVFGVMFVPFLLQRWRRRRQGERPPEMTKLLRPPGHSLMVHLEQVNDRMNDHAWVGLASSFCFVFTAWFWWVLFTNEVMMSQMSKEGFWRTVTLPGLLPTFLSSMFFFTAGCLGLLFTGIKSWALMKETRACRLGLRGEQAVAEELAKLAAVGFRSFHDLPAGDNWNIDHVVVGPPGVFCLETKTRSKRKASPGVNDFEVVYDGKELRFPWGTDRKAVRQTAANARWLAEHLTKSTGMSVEVLGVVVIPGWYVSSQGDFPIKAMNAKYLMKYLPGLPQRLDEGQIQRIAFQVEQKCRDIEF